MWGLPDTGRRRGQSATAASTVVLMVALLTGLWPQECSCLRIDKVIVPKMVRAGDTVELTCLYDLEGAALYSLTWWKGAHQFYQYSADDTTGPTVYNAPGLQVDRTRSGETVVVLRNVSLESTGRYKCEVLAEYPSFEKEIQMASMKVVEVPPLPPIVRVGRLQWRTGEQLVARCSSEGGHPRPSLVWYINGYKVQDKHSRPIRLDTQPPTSSVYEWPNNNYNNYLKGYEDVQGAKQPPVINYNQPYYNPPYDIYGNTYASGSYVPNTNDNYHAIKNDNYPPNTNDNYRQNSNDNYHTNTNDNYHPNTDTGSINYNSYGTRSPGYPGGYGTKRDANSEYSRKLSSSYGSGSISFGIGVSEEAQASVRPDADSGGPDNDRPAEKQAVELRLLLRPDHFKPPGVAILRCAAELPGIHYSKKTDVRLTLPGIPTASPSHRLSHSSTHHLTLPLVSCVLICWLVLGFGGLE